jgi:hypothetical protein
MQTELMFYPVDSLASHTAQQGNDLERKMIATSGRSCLQRYEQSNRGGLWARTFAALLVGMEGWYSMRCRLTWKLKGTKSSRLYFQLAPSTPPTEGTGYGLLLKTPTMMDGHVSSGKAKPVSGDSGTLAQEIMSGYKPTMAKLGMLPTPSASDNRDRGHLGNPAIQRRIEIGKQIGLTMIMNDGQASQLNPRFVAEMMGFPPNWTELPFQNGGKNP